MQADRILEQDFCAIPDLIRTHAAQRPRHAALVHEGRVLDYAGLDALMDRVAASLQREGLKPEDTIAICAGTSLQYALVFLGALRAGARAGRRAHQLYRTRHPPTGASFNPRAPIGRRAR